MVNITGYVCQEDETISWPAFEIKARNNLNLPANYGTITAINGYFSIDIPSGYYLDFSFLGFETQVLGPFYYNTDLGNIVMKEETSPEGQSSKVEQSVLYDPAGLLIA